MKTPNLTLIFIAITAVVLGGLAGGVVLTIVGKDATAFYGFFTATLATLVAFAGLLRSQAKIAEKVTAVQHNVNGRLSELINLAAGNVDTRQQMNRVREIAIDAGLENQVPRNSLEDDDEE